MCRMIDISETEKKCCKKRKARKRAKMKKRILEKFGKMAYRVFLKPYLKRKIKDNNYEWDDKMFKILDKMIREW